MTNNDTSVVICCAGMGTRLGIGSPKALVDICGKPLIIRLLELLDDFDDIRIVVGFEAEKIIEVCKEYRKDIMFVFNYDYENNGPAASLCKALVGSKKYILSIDGDILVNKDDFEKMVENEEFLSISNKTSDEPTLVTVQDGLVTDFSNSGNYEWQGIVKINKNKLVVSDEHIYDMFVDSLPIKGIFVKSREIDTQDDYENAIRFYKNGCM